MKALATLMVVLSALSYFAAHLAVAMWLRGFVWLYAIIDVLFVVFMVMAVREYIRERNINRITKGE